MTRYLPPSGDDETHNQGSRVVATRDHPWNLERTGVIATPEIHLKELLGTLKRRWIIILLATVSVVGGATYLISKDRPIYAATAMVRHANARGAITAGLAGEAAEMDPLASQLQILRSRGVAEEVAVMTALQLQPLTEGFPRELLHDVTMPPASGSDTLSLTFGPSTYSVWHRGATQTAEYNEPVAIRDFQLTITGNPGLKRATLVSVPMRTVIGQLQSGLIATPRGKTDILDLTFQSTDPHEAQVLANAFAQTFQSHSARSAKNKSRLRRVFIEEQINLTDEALRSATANLIAFRSREHVQSLRSKFSAHQEGLMSLDARRAELDADAKMYESLLSTMTGPTPSISEDGIATLVSSPSVASNAVVSQLFRQLFEYETQLAEKTTGQWPAAVTYVSCDFSTEGLVKE